MIKLASITIATALLMVGCLPSEPTKTEVTYVPIVITKVKRPKHFRVYVRDLNTNSEFKLRSSKHCGSWRKIKVGDKFNIQKRLDYYEDGEVSVTYFPRSCDLAKNPLKWRM